ncbi:PepSY-associated TM helix domain-containing protein [Dyadobacter fanqingshengii]|uniref:PepSY domain-containing protein n=1 Tax=Dyadobacter fanqingshengii TaxID=2906443 RepID=A0A9X1P6Y1_9BACT|nr:PepSY-associated TM helix domain-containing protein [Dyadobacter fanqingshengii]MCF0039160.1 PepSY domain-containing protein [Dyadobacter fanqingshengii]USJ34020.1 PepSY domain-containing protein [Dyadobacter fanqingshengii]
MKKLIGTLHLYLGLASGIVVFVVAITGCILAFEQEIKSFTQPYMFVEPPANAKVLPPSVLQASAEKMLPGKKANGVLYGVPTRNAEVGFYNADPEYYYVVYVNPYTAEVKHVWNEEGDFFHFILHGHYYLWLPPTIGQPVVASATLIFLVMLISGLVLWWPKNKSAAKQRFSIKWDAAWRRKNYDLHNVFGFYVLSIGFLLGSTGLVWGFKWFSQGLYTVTGGKGSDEYYNPVSDSTLYSSAFTPITSVDKVWYTLRKEYPVNTGINISIPHLKSESIFSYVNFREGTYYSVDYNYFDQYSLKKIKATGPYSGRYKDADFANKLRRMNYDIHVGAILGLPGKIIVFLASLICASLPVTGTVIWWGRRKKSKKTRKNLRVLKPDLVIR